MSVSDDWKPTAAAKSIFSVCALTVNERYRTAHTGDGMKVYQTWVSAPSSALFLARNKQRKQMLLSTARPHLTPKRTTYLIGSPSGGIELYVDIGRVGHKEKIRSCANIEVEGWGGDAGKSIICFVGRTKKMG